MRLFSLLATASLLCTATSTPLLAQSAASSAPSAAITAAVADPARPDADKARDAARKPAQAVAFAGVKPGDVIAEIAPGGGYFTPILAKAVGPNGHVYALMPAAFANRPGGLDAINAIAAAYPNVTVLTVDFNDFTLPKPADLVWTTENYHDIANGNIAAANASVFKALKPGGGYYVQDHAAPGTGTSATRTLHRIDPEAVKEQVKAAGFAFESDSDFLTNPNDSHALSANDPAIRGQTSKFALRFRKPG